METTQTPRRPKRAFTLADLRNLPPIITLPVAGEAYGWSRARTYQLHQAGEFPVPVVQIGQRFFIKTAELAASLGVDPSDLLTQVAPPAAEIAAAT